mmetsp:Transcript_75620/g.215167  ORF Transcript_75620/g.215167 Transcript_75620/m.215167 type:complete len:110 (-) Transcript_75620:1041-1370(-)
MTAKHDVKLLADTSIVEYSCKNIPPPKPCPAVHPMNSVLATVAVEEYCAIPPPPPFVVVAEHDMNLVSDIVAADPVLALMPPPPIDVQEVNTALITVYVECVDEIAPPL